MIIRPWLLISAIFSCSLMLSACNSGEALTKPTVTPDELVSSTTASSTSSSPHTQKVIGIPMKVACNELMTPANLYEYNPNFSYDPSAKLFENFATKQIAELNGINCVFLNLSSQQTVQLSVAHISQDSLEEVTDMVKNIPGILIENSPEGVATYFLQDSTIGITIEIVDDYFISVASEGFQQASDTHDFITPVIGSLK